MTEIRREGRCKRATDATLWFVFAGQRCGVAWTPLQPQCNTIHHPQSTGSTMAHTRHHNGRNAHCLHNRSGHTKAITRSRKVATKKPCPGAVHIMNGPSMQRWNLHALCSTKHVSNVAARPLPNTTACVCVCLKSRPHAPLASLRGRHADITLCLPHPPKPLQSHHKPRVLRSQFSHSYSHLNQTRKKNNYNRLST